MEVTGLYDLLEVDLRYVEEQLQVRLQTADKRLEEASTHLLLAGGKRLRPVFVLLAGMFGEYDVEVLGKVAVGLELIHMATLVHDDVIDHAGTRRGQLTVKARFGNQMAMIAGDYIFAQSLDLLAEIRNAKVHSILSRAIWRMVAGEIEQIRDLYKVEQTLLPYLRRIRRKTALLIEMSCTLGAMAVQADPGTVHALRRYGYCTGMAFQIIDDILDFTATTERLGKPVGGDLRQGNLTAPVLFAMREPQCATQLTDLISSVQTEEQVERAIGLIKSSNGIAKSRRLAELYLQKADEALKQLPEGIAKESLLALSNFVGQRDY